MPSTTSGAPGTLDSFLYNMSLSHSWPYAYYILALFLLHKGRVHLLCALLSVEFGRGRLVPINNFNKNSHNLSYTLFTTKKLETLGLLTNLYFAPPLPYT